MSGLRQKPSAPNGARWAAGEVIAHRGIVHGRVWIAHAVHVIEDSDQGLALYLQPGAQCMIPSGLIGRKYSGPANNGSRWDEQDGGDWQLVESPWRHRRAVILLPPDTYYAVFWFWPADTGEFEGWYINFQRPYRRTATTLDTLDLEIDLIISPDGSWRWKDEDEYWDGVRRGSISAEDARQVAAAREEVLGLIGTTSTLFDPRWLSWRAHPDWLPPALPLDWQKAHSPASAKMRSERRSEM